LKSGFTADRRQLPTSLWPRKLREIAYDSPYALLACDGSRYGGRFGLRPKEGRIDGFKAVGKAFYIKVSKKRCLDRHTIRTEKRWTLLTISASSLLRGESRRPKRPAGCCSIDRSYR